MLQQLSKFPILLLMLCHLWLDPERDHDLPESITELYAEGVIYLNKHWVKKYPKDIDKVLTELGHFAIDSLFENRLTFEQTGVVQDECLQDACDIGLVFTEELEGNREGATFIHKTFHE